MAMSGPFVATRATYYAMQVTESQVLDKLHYVSASITRSCNCEFAANVMLYLRNSAS